MGFQSQGAFATVQVVYVQRTVTTATNEFSRVLYEQLAIAERKNSGLLQVKSTQKISKSGGRWASYPVVHGVLKEK